MSKATRTLLFAVFAVAVPAVAFAQGGDAAMAGADNAFTTAKFVALACGFGIALAAFGGALGQGRAAAAALEGIARNPSASDKLFVPMILALALIESLVIYALVIAFTLVGNVGPIGEIMAKMFELG